MLADGRFLHRYTTNMDISKLRTEYTQHGLERDKLHPNPFDQFALWFQQACKADLIEPNSMALATASARGEPTIRMMLLKYYDERGFVFFTNYESDKAKQMAENPQVALLFPWTPLQRQLKIVGRAEKVPTAESLKYFLTRPRGSQLGAWSSPQSQVVTSRQLLELQFDKMRRKFAAGEVPLPSFWGGYRVVPHRFEFWQGRENRLHDRFLYRRGEEGAWEIERLAP